LPLTVSLDKKTPKFQVKSQYNLEFVILINFHRFLLILNKFFCFFQLMAKVKDNRVFSS